MNRFADRLACALAVSVFLLLSGPDLVAQISPDGPKQLSAPAEGLNVVSFPGFEGMEPAVREQLRAVRDGLYNEATGRTTNKALGDAYGLAGRTYHAYSITETAAQCYRNAAVLQPGDFRWRHVLGLALTEMNKPYEALEALKESSKLSPKYLPSHVVAGNTYLELNLNGLAAEAFKSAAALNPRDPAVLFGLGRVKYEQKDFKAAAAYFERVLEIVPAANRVHYSLALTYRNLNDDAKAKEHLAKQGQVGIKVADPLRESIDQLKRGTRPKLLEAKTALDAGQFDAAAAIYLEVLKTEPDNVTALVNIGAAYLRLKKASLAVKAFERVVKLKPYNINALYNLGVIYSLAGQPSRSIGHFRALLKIAPNDLDARYRLAGQLRKANLPDESLVEYRKVLEKSPENETVFLDLVSLMSSKGMDRELFAMLKQKHEQFPSRGQTAAAYAFALASSPVLELRDGKKALSIASAVYAASKTIEHGMLVATALSEIGKCADAKELIGILSARATNEKRIDLSPRLAAQMKRLEDPAGCRP